MMNATPNRQVAIADWWLSDSAKQRELDAIGVVLSELAHTGARLETVLSVVAEKSATTTDASGAAIALLENGEFICRASYGEAAPAGSKLDINSGLSGECLRTGSAVRCDDAEMDPRVNAYACRAMKLRSIAAVPLKRGEQVVGLLEVFSSQTRAFAEEHMATLERMTSAVLAAVNRGSPFVDDSWAADVGPAHLVARDAANFTAGPEIEEIPQRSDLAISTSVSRRWARLAVFAILLVATLGFSAWRWSGWDGIRLSPLTPLHPASAATFPHSVLAAKLRIAADAGDAHSQFLLGSLYVRGQEVPQDYQEAAKWFERSAQQGNVSAQSMLGTLYFDGRGVPQDNVNAYLWTKLAADAGSQISINRLPQVTALLSLEDLSDAQKRIAEWRKTHTASPRASTY